MSPIQSKLTHAIAILLLPLLTIVKPVFSDDKEPTKLQESRPPLVPEGEKLFEPGGMDGFIKGILTNMGQALSATYSPDGKRLALASADGTIWIWDVESGKVLQQLSENFGPIRSITYSPDGKHLALASAYGTARIWDVQSGKELQQFSGDSGGIWSVTYSPDGKRLASISDDGTVRIWDVESGKKLNWLPHPTSRILTVKFSPDGKHLASNSDDGTIWIWDVESGDVLQQLSENFGSIQPMTYLSDTGPPPEQSGDRK
jgi:WD40 repeat protein